ncbi:hypothetical protein POSPLADRAFT_1134965 [Postia placenta MAD-698-R-SB12]|uniref:Alkyl transferase n=1 Tax=Postia placenta MAD-698-R-SB12 TaxID=670580 RepID=A0A1X6NAH2_9APHY|nr:hypothetical protein POSPLADRAFT_1134965 [Postia placenta MAD-698-R-SB12]OSX65649.1 hypothetical protein POSPLADRAFT_1134965 [Postia placenta MAD-698-R-SB12]
MLSFVSRPFGWLVATASKSVQNALLAVLAAGPIPQHIAFVMDGNRRYARSHHKRVQEGHADGFLALRRVRPMPLCLCARAHGALHRSLRYACA